MATVDTNAMCALLVTDTPSAKPRHVVVTGGRATFGTNGTVRVGGASVAPTHAYLTNLDGAWTVRAEADGVVTVNGVRARRAWALEGCDRIGIGDASIVFLPTITTPAIGPSNGFSRARHYLQQAVEAKTTDRKFVEVLAGLEEAVVDGDKYSVLQRAIKHMNDEANGKAIQELDRVLAVSPKHANALMHKSMCVFREGRGDEARALAQQALTAAGDDRELRTEVNEWIEKMRTLGPRLTQNTAIKQMNASNFYGAIHILTQGLIQFPGDPGLLFHLAICEANTGSAMAARMTLGRITGHVADPELRNDIADLRMKLGRY